MLRVALQSDATPAEYLYDAGKILKFAETCDCSDCLRYRETQTDFSRLARQFYAANGGLVFRALFEGWGLAHISLELSRVETRAREG